jgi:hypothetical protein
VVSKILLHVGFTFGLGTVLVLVLVGIRAILEVEGRSRVGVVACHGIAFLLVLAIELVPERITRVDADRGVMHVTRVLPVPPWTTSANAESRASRMPSGVESVAVGDGVASPRWSASAPPRSRRLPASSTPRSP